MPNKPDASLWEGLPLGLEAYRNLVWEQGRSLYRELPWRNIDDPYAVLVSEVMLQQTQVKRVLGYWPRFMALFPTLDALASADTALVLEMWQGLGYNRRALALKRCAEECSERYRGKLPCSREELLALPGIGPATAGGIEAFAFQRPTLYLETNVRTVFLHELFPGEEGVSDKMIEPLVLDSCPTSDPRAWYYALLDYGAHLKATVPNPSRRSKHHSKQSKFEGSRRQKRAELVRVVLAQGKADFGELSAALSCFERDHGRDAVDDALVADILSDLVSEGFLQKEPGGYSVG